MPPPPPPSDTPGVVRAEGPVGFGDAVDGRESNVIFFTGAGATTGAWI